MYIYICLEKSYFNFTIFGCIGFLLFLGGGGGGECGIPSLVASEAGPLFTEVWGFPLRGLSVLPSTGFRLGALQ